ncbi:hypothetical protein BD309DRAFT_878495, partial [Dichomitus squalens]
GIAFTQFGLVALRLAESFILPLNTTYYAHRPDKYLDEVDEGLGASADISGLRKSIARLQGASRALDKERETAEQHMRELLDKFLHPGRSIHTGIGTDPSTPSINIATARGSTASRFRKSFGGCWTSYLGTEARRGWDPIRKFFKAMERVQTANAKLIAFEHGFISEEGVEDRKWYTHLGVALGKWQGTRAIPEGATEVESGKTTHIAIMLNRRPHNVKLLIGCYKMRLSVFAVIAAAFAAVGAVPTAGPEVVTPGSGDIIGFRTESQYESILIATLNNATTENGFDPQPEFSKTDPTTATARLNVDSTKVAEGDYNFTVTEYGLPGVIYSTSFPVSLNYDV